MSTITNSNENHLSTSGTASPPSVATAAEPVVSFSSSAMPRNGSTNTLPQAKQTQAHEQTLPSPPATQATEQQVEALRPTLVVCLGGTGQLIGTRLKALLLERLGEASKRRVRLLAFDTTEEPFDAQTADSLITLETGSEFFNIGNVPVPSIMANIESQKAIQERLGTILHTLPASVMRSGAKQIRPLGLLALLWNYATIFTELKKAIWRLAGRDMLGANHATNQQGINVFLCGSLVGGTCSGTLIDVAYLIKSLFNDLGAQGEFCHLTAVTILPQAFQGIQGPNLYSNTAAALKEINHVMTRGHFQARYPDNRLITMPQSPFNLIYALDGVDERGQTWANVADVAAMAAQGIYLQMASQLGRKGDNAFDNVEDVLIGQTPDGYGTFYASFGLGTIEFPSTAVARLFAHWLLYDVLTSAWLAPAVADNMQLEERLHELTPVQLRQTLQRDTQTGGEMRVNLRQPAWLANKPPNEVSAEAAQYIRDYNHIRLQQELLLQIEDNAQRQMEQAQERWDSWLNAVLFTPTIPLAQINDTLKATQTQLQSWVQEGRRRLSEADSQLAQAQVQFTQQEHTLAQAGNSLPFGRRGRVRNALKNYFQAGQELQELQFQAALLRSQVLVWQTTAQGLANRQRQLHLLLTRLQTLKEAIAHTAVDLLNTCQAGGVSRLSLADEKYLRQLYQQNRPAQVNLLALSYFQQMGITALDLLQSSLANLKTALLRATQELFNRVGQLSVEEVLRDRAAEMTPRARRQQLFHLATPSWSIDRTRLPDGGASLVRLEVMGVPNESDTLFDDEAMLVSTHDPQRLVALVVVAGAPQSALQQHDLYLSALERVRRQRPMYVLPQFMADANQGKLAFALGSLFGLIYSQGTHFYYQPIDRLEMAERLGNGLGNAIQTLIANEQLVREIIERVEALVAQRGLQQVIQTLADYYQIVPDGRTAVDEMNRELKQLVRRYADELRQINEFNAGLQG